MKFKRWEVWTMDVSFEDCPNQSKRRPVLVIDENTAIVVKITTHSPRPNFAGEYALAKWQQAGLSKQSTVRISKLIRVRQTDLINKIGDIDPSDRVNILRIYNILYRKQTE